MDAQTVKGTDRGAKRDPPVVISVAVCTHKRPSGLDRLLKTLLPQIARAPGRELIVVNDGTDDAAYQNIIAAAGSGLRYDVLPRPQGVAAARNRATALARGTFIAFVDDDCIAPDHWCDWLEAHLSDAPWLDIVSGTTRPLWPKRRTLAARRDAHFNLIPYPHPADGYRLFVTANVAIRRAAILQAGGFGFPGFVGAGEDSELCARLIAQGARLRTDLDWYVLHEVGASFRKQMRRFRLYGFSNVKMSKLPHAPGAYVGLSQAERSWWWPHAKAEFRQAWRQSHGFSPWRIIRLYGALTTAAFKLSYLAGCIKAAQDIRSSERG